MHVAQNWRVNAQRYTMRGNYCAQCDSLIFPPRAVCPYCGAENVATVPRERSTRSRIAVSTRLNH